MGSIPANIARVPTLLTAQIFGSNIARTNLSLLELQNQMATLKSVNRFSDDAIKASAISALEDGLERIDQRTRNLTSAENTVNLLDSSIGEASDLVLEAKSIALGQIGATSDAGTRRNQASIIDSMIRQLYGITNRSINGLHIFGGSTPTSPPVSEVNGFGLLGYRYTARGSGLVNDLGIPERIPITLGSANTLGSVSARHQSTADLNPALTLDTRVADLNGGRGLGVSAGRFTFSFDGGPSATVDIAGADTVGGVVNAITDAIRQYEADQGVTILGPGGVSISGGRLSIDVVGGTPDPDLVFSEVGPGTTASDLGLTVAGGGGAFNVGSAVGGDLDPKLTDFTPLSALSGVTLPLGSVRVRFTRGDSTSFRDVDLSSATTIGELRNLMQSHAPGVRVEINPSGRGINILSEISGPGLSIEEVPGGANTATQLGIRTFGADTRIADFNSGRGVRIVTGSIDPATGTPDPSRDVDFVIHLGDGSSFTVDLRPQDMVSVQTVIDRINAQAADAVTAGQIPAGAFTAGLSDGPNGISFFDTGGLGAMRVERLNNSAAAQDLGLLDGVFDSGSARFTAADRAQVRVENLFTVLMDLRDALLGDDSAGISLAAQALDENSDRLAQTRALVGVYAGRIEGAKVRHEDQRLLQERFKSELQDLDFARASIRFTMLQTQLQASLQTAGLSQNRSLLDFLR